MIFLLYSGPIAACVNMCFDECYFGDEAKVNDFEHCRNIDYQYLEHAILIVGYGVNDKGKEYWIIKNSYGNKWFDHGYIKIPRNENYGGIAWLSTYPVIKTD